MVKNIFQPTLGGYMDSILWLARILGPYYVIMGLWMLLRPDDVQKMWNSVKNTPPMIYFGAALQLLIGLTILSTYHGWTLGLPVLLTIIGYLIVLKGIVALFMPEKLVTYSEKLMAYPQALSIAALVIGALLTYLAVAG